MSVGPHTENCINAHRVGVRQLVTLPGENFVRGMVVRSKGCTCDVHPGEEVVVEGKAIPSPQMDQADEAQSLKVKEMERRAENLNGSELSDEKGGDHV